ncbi:MAG: hypothetical protein WAV90_23185 [Gordonia amarae]
MKNVRRRIRVAAISIAVAVPALLSIAPAGAAPAKDATVYYPVTPPCIPTPNPTGSVHPCTPYWLMSILEVMSMGSTEGTGSAGSSTGS